MEVKTKEAEKERAIKIIEEKLKKFEEKKEHEAEANPKEKSKKTGHFWSDCKVQKFIVRLNWPTQFEYQSPEVTS